MMCCLASSSERDRGVVVIPNAGQTSSTGTLSAYHLTSAAGFRLQQVFRLRALSGDEQFCGSRIHARPPQLANSSAQFADLGSKSQDLQGSRFIHGNPGHP
jgi:hypothetical protein